MQTTGCVRRVSCGDPRSGRGSSGLALILACLALSGCRLVAPDPPTPGPAEVLEGPPIAEGLADDTAAREAAQLLAEGEAFLEAGRAAEARERARDVEARYPTVPGTSVAVWLRARSSVALEDWDDAAAAVDRYLELIAQDFPAYGPATLLRAEVRRAGNLPGGVEALFDIPEGAGEDVLSGAEELATRWAEELDTSALRDLTLEAPPHPRVLPPFLVELAVRRHVAGNPQEAGDLAERALALSPGEPTATRARSVLAGEVEAETAVAAVLGAILPGSGSSPSAIQLSQEIRDGIEVALVMEDARGGPPVRLVFREHGSGNSGIAEALSQLEANGVAGVVGPLLDPAFDAAVRSRTGAAPLLSPTARMLPQGSQGAFSLTSVDPEAARVLAQLVLQQGIRSAVVIHTQSQEMNQEAQWFREAFTTGGGTVIRTLSYPVGATGFAAQLEEVVRLVPPALVVILPSSDIPMFAPQIAYYGVDDLDDLTIFGNESWTSDPVLRDVQPRHTDGILSVTSWPAAGEFGPGWDAFVVAYEEHFQRTLRSPMAALGYDAARLLIHAARDAGGDPEGTVRALEGIRDFPGATGRLSVVNGRIQRDYVPVRIQGRQLYPLNL